MKIKDFKHTKLLFKLNLRRDRLKYMIWFFVVLLLVIGVVIGNSTFDGIEKINMAKVAILNPGMRLMLSPISEASIPHLGAFFFMRMSFIWAIMISLLSSSAVIRHSRENEESGCFELIGSSVVGRYAQLSAAILNGFILSIGFGLAMFLGLISQDLDILGSIAGSLSFVGLGFLFSGVGAIGAQLSSSSKGSKGFSSLVLAVVYLTNGIGNVMGEVFTNGLGFKSHWLVWFSPIGWVQQVFPYDRNNIWPLSLLVITTCLCVCLAFILVRRRDVGQGVFAAKKGRAYAKKWMKKTIGMVFRLQRNTILAWSIALFLIGIIFGAASESYGETIEGIEFFDELFKASANIFRFLLIALVASIISIFSVTSFMRLRHEEKHGSLEVILSSSKKRHTILSSYVLVSILASVFLVGLFTTGVALGAQASTEVFIDLVKAATIQSIGIIAVVSVAIFLFGVLPKKMNLLIWIFIAVSIIFGPFIGPITQMPDFLLALSVFHHLDVMPSDFVWSNAMIILLLSIGCMLIGFVNFEKRDLSF